MHIIPTSQHRWQQLDWRLRSAANKCDIPHEKAAPIKTVNNQSTRQEQRPDSTFTINIVGIRVPPFWSEKPAVWFAQLEGQFALSNITQEATNFFYVISQTDNNALPKWRT